MTQIQIDKNDLQDLVIYAERYAIGRMTYAPSDVSRIIIKYLSDLKLSVIKILIQDIKQESERNNLGEECDKVTWLNLLNILEKELEERTQ